MKTHLNLHIIHSDILNAPNQYRICIKTHLNLHNLHPNTLDAQNQLELP